MSFAANQSFRASPKELSRTGALGLLPRDQEQAKALRDNPELFKLRELEALIEMAQAGGSFAVGLRTPSASSLLADVERADANKPRS